MGAVVIAAGGTGGHVYPALAVARELAAARPDTAVSFAGTCAGMEARVVPAAGFPYDAVRSAPWRRGSPWTLASAAWNSVLGAAGAVRVLRRRKAGAVFSTGGYASAPVLLAALALRIPFVLHEPNAEPGAVTRLFGRFARLVTAGSDEAARRFPAGRTLVTGVPVRPDLLAVDRREARSRLGLGAEFTVLALGGSQGASAINDAFAGALPALRRSGLPLALVWLAGRGDFARCRELAADAGFPVMVFDYLDDIGTALRAADLAVARAGASTVAELSAAGLPALFIPYPHAAANHQERNARALEDRGAALVLDEANLTPKSLAFRIAALAGDPEAVGRMSARAGEAGRPNAARAVAAAVLAAMEGKPC